MAEIKRSQTRDVGVMKYIGHFNPDKYVFHLLLVLTLVFMVLFTIGTSVPAWYVLQEHVTNVSTCSTADRYVEPHIRRYWHHGKSELMLSASLWFINVRLSHEDTVYRKFVPFLLIQRDDFTEKEPNGMVVETIFPKCLSTIVTITFLCLGVAFTCTASNRPSRLIYYGLSSVMIIAAITTWISITIVSSEKFLLSVAYDLCVSQGVLKTSFLLQMVTGSTGILAFVFACILIHLAILINQKFLEESNKVDEEIAHNMKEKISMVLHNAQEVVVPIEKKLVYDY